MTFARHGILTEQRALYKNIVPLGKVQFCACSEVTQLRRSPFQPNWGAGLGGLQDSDSSHQGPGIYPGDSSFRATWNGGEGTSNLRPWDFQDDKYQPLPY
jgi:hypothetical protein